MPLLRSWLGFWLRTKARRGLSGGRRRRLIAVAASLSLVGGIGLTTLPSFTGVASAAPPAAFTTTDVLQGTGACLNGNSHGGTTDVVNCNIYPSKGAVWLNGGPAQQVGGAGTYFFAVLDPGGQHNPNDGAPGLLSTDSYLNRTFSVDLLGHITYTGDGPGETPHLFDQAENKLQLLSYNDTTNNGGVYILAICQLISPGFAQPVTPKSCKYDAFKIMAPAPCINNNADCNFTPAADPGIFKTADGSFTKTYTWSIQKGVAQSPLDTSSSATANYTVTVTNTGSPVSQVAVTGYIDVTNENVDSSNQTAPIKLDSVTDALSGSVTQTCSVETDGLAPVGTDGIPAQSSGLTLNAADNYFPYSCTLSSIPSTELDNNAEAAWSDQTLDNGTFLAEGSVPFEFFNVPFATETDVNACVTINDAVDGHPAVALGVVCQDGTFTAPSPAPDNFVEAYSAPSFTLTYSRTFNDSAGTCTTHDNTATIVETKQSDDASVQVCVGKELTVAKTALTSYIRTYNWTVNKQVDKTKVTVSSGSATFNYSVGVSQTGFTDGTIQVNGTITVTNPNDWESVTLTGVVDSIGSGWSCHITAGGASPTATIAKSDAVTLDYTCTHASPLPGSGTNTATASWSSSAAFTPHGSAMGTAPVTFGTPASTVNKTVTPTDIFNGDPAVNLCVLDPTGPCQLTATDTPTFTSHTYTYSRTVMATQSCSSYTNTAATGTGAKSSKTVTVCGPGGLSKGFWQNKNGQGIITKYCGGASGTSLSAYLTGFNPFKDMTATSCSGEAAYVYGVIKGATAGGAAMNPMLKAQMLAAALDVYFSDPSLGGSKISAFGGGAAPLGGFKVDLTKIPGGNTAAAFGGTSCQTVNQLLTYAAGQSNPGGSAWYNQLKSTQGLASNTFDAIDNSQTVSC
jgi:hypothetical protein